MRAAYAFGGPIRDSIHRFKYQGEFARAPFLANLVFGAMKRPEFPDDQSWDLVAYVPLHSRRRRQRGFDQSRLIARHLATSLEIPAATDLKRVIDTPSQVGRSAAERRANVIDAFAWSGEDLAGAKILLVDDVITTGSTMMSASRALIRAGAKRVDAIAIARETLR
ncbi:MAG TPA: ComF family protein [Nitrolancea sp.]|jgi:ComF family protein|nr:ComF family protein [Nitrolancea sp.]